MREENPDIAQFECSVFNGIYVTKDVDLQYLEYLQSLRNDDAKAIARQNEVENRNCITKVKVSLRQTKQGGRNPALFVLYLWRRSGYYWRTLLQQGRIMKRLIIGISGASGAIYGVRMLQVLQPLAEVETHLVMSPAARQTLALETDYSLRDVQALADVVHDVRDIAASISSGSFKTLGMAIVPCSMKTLSGIVHSYSDSLLTRAADVVLKEQRRLVLCVRKPAASRSSAHDDHRCRTRRADYAAGAGVLSPPAAHRRFD